MSDEFGPSFITLTDEDGNDIELEYVDALEHEGQTYMAFFPAVEDEADEESEDYGLVILKSVTENGEEPLSTLDDEAELEKIYELFMEQLLADEEEKIPDRFCENPFYFSRRSVIIRPSPKGEVPQDVTGLFILTFCYRGCRISMWIAGLPAAVCGWKLEAVKHAGDNPPAETVQVITWPPTPGGTTGKSPVSSGRPPELTAFFGLWPDNFRSPLHSRQISCIITINFTKSGRNDPYFERMKQL